MSIITHNGDRLADIIKELIELSPNTSTCLKIIITVDNVKVVETHRHPDQLKKSGYSMRNIKGEFIKDIIPNV